MGWCDTPHHIGGARLMEHLNMDGVVDGSCYVCNVNVLRPGLPLWPPPVASPNGHGSTVPRFHGQDCGEGHAPLVGGFGWHLLWGGHETLKNHPLPWLVVCCLVLWNHGILFSIQLGRMIPTDKLIFFRGVGIPPTSNCVCYIIAGKRLSKYSLRVYSISISRSTLYNIYIYTYI